MSYWSERAVRAIVLGAALWVGAVTLVWLFVPLGESTSTSASSTGVVTTTSTHESLLESEGSSVVIVLSVAAQGTWWRRRARVVSGALLLFGSLLGAMSVGLPYLPAAVALLVAGLRTQPPSRVSAVRADP